MSTADIGGAKPYASLTSKELVWACMDIEEASEEKGFLGLNVKGFRISCPCCDYCKFASTKQGFTNNANHFRSCTKEQGERVYLARVQKKKSVEQANLLAAAEDAAACNDEDDDKDGGDGEKKKRKIQTALRNISDEHESLLMWIEKIVLLNEPVGIMTNELARKHAKWPLVKSKETVLDTMFHLVEIVEDKIALMMAKSPGCQVLHDGWTKNGTHFLGIYASFMKPLYAVHEGKRTLQAHNHECRLLAVSPMPALTSDDQEGEVVESEAVHFDAKHQVNMINKTFSYYNKDADDFVLCQCADSASVNIKTSKLLGVPHVSCKNHNLSLQSNEMVKNDAELQDVTKRVCDFSAAVRVSAKATTALRNAISAPGQHSSVRAKARSATRQWIGEERALGAHIKLQEHFATLLEEGVGNLEEHRDTLDGTFIEKTKKFHTYLEQIRKTSASMQEKKVSLGECQELLDVLMEQVKSGFHIPTSIFHGCELKTNKIKPANRLSTDPAFETGVAKIQENVQYENLMSVQEVRACKKLLKTAGQKDEEEDSDSSCSEDVVKVIAARKKRKLREMLGVSKYANLNFIMGSAAVVEQLWSKSDCVYTKRRAGLSPLVFEMIMFLKENRDLWSVYDVAEANDRRKTKNRKSRAQQRIAKNTIVEALAVPYVSPKKS